MEWAYRPTEIEGFRVLGVTGKSGVDACFCWFCYDPSKASQALFGVSGSVGASTADRDMEEAILKEF